MKSLLYILLGIVGLAIVAFIALPFVISPDFVARKVAEAVKEQTGRELMLGDESSFSFYPDLAVELNDVTLTNPPGMAAGNLLLTDRLLVKVALMPLLSGNVDVEEFIVEAPRLNLLIDGQGHSNWVLDAAAADKPLAEVENQEPADGIDVPQDVPDSVAVPFDSIKFAPIEIRNGALRYLDERSGTNFLAEDVNLTLHLADLTSPFGARGSLIWNGQRITLDANLRQPAQLASGSSSAVDVTLDSPLLNAGYEGQISLKDGISLAGVIALSTPSLRDFAQWAGQKLAPGNGLGAFRADSAIGLQGQTLTLKDAKIALDGMNGQGTVRLELQGPRPKIIATLGVDRIDLNQYLGAAAPPAGQGPGAPAIAAGWSSEPMELAGLKALDADLTLNAGGLLFDTVKVDAVSMKLLLEAGLLETRLTNASLYGGTAVGSVQIDGSKPVPTLQIAMSANNFDGYSLLRDFSGLDRVEGQAAASVQVFGTGRSQLDLVSTLRGKVAFRFTDGAVRGVNLAQMIRNVATGVVDGWQGDSQQLTDFSVFEASFDIENGLAANNDLSLLGPLVRVTGEGSIDLPTQRLDYRIDPKLVATLQGQGSTKDLEGFNIPIVVKGPWNKPRIYPDIENILKDPQAAYKKFKGLVASTGSLDLGSGKKAAQDVLGSGVEGIISGQAGEILGSDEAGAALGATGKQFLDGLMGGAKPEEGTAQARPSEPIPAAPEATGTVSEAPASGVETPAPPAAPEPSPPVAAPDPAPEAGAGNPVGKGDAQ